MEEMCDCRFCFNAAICDELTADNDLSYMSVGKADEKHRIEIMAGAGRGVRILFSEKTESGIMTVGDYVPKYCPECGRRLFENGTPDTHKEEKTYTIYGWADAAVVKAFRVSTGKEIKMHMGWTVYGSNTIKAESVDDAIYKAYGAPLFADGEYVDGSFITYCISPSVTDEEVEEAKRLANEFNLDTLDFGACYISESYLPDENRAYEEYGD